MFLLRPFTRTQPILLPGEERRQSSIVTSNPSTSNGGTSNPSTPQSSGSPLTAPTATVAANVPAVASVSPNMVSVGTSSAVTVPIASLNLIKSTYKGEKDFSIDFFEEICLNDPFDPDIVMEEKSYSITVDPASHTRNSSTTSQVSQGSGYGSQSSQPIPAGDKGHSRQSSSGGESNHGRYVYQRFIKNGFFLWKVRGYIDYLGLNFTMVSGP